MEIAVEYVIGLVLAVVVFVGAQVTGLTRDRAFYAIALIVIATYYVLFAALTGSVLIVTQESLAALLFIAAAIVGFKRFPWLVVIGIGGHGVFDAVHHHFIENPGVPSWWPGFCGTFDVVYAACLGGLLVAERRRSARPHA